MKSWIYCKRNLKELISDPLSLVFTFVLPAFLLVFMISLNQSFAVNIAFQPENFVPSTIIFSFSFLTMFSGLLIAKDRSSSFLSRMYISPLKAHNYIIGYMLPIWMISLIQIIILYSIGFIMGLPFTIHIILSIPFLLIISSLFITLGLLLGSLLKDQQIGPVASILIQIVAFLSGMWFSLDLIGGVFMQIGYILPFAHSVDLIKQVLQGNYNGMWVSLLVVLIYISVTLFFAVKAFKRNMKT